MAIYAYVYFNPNTLRYLTASLDSGWSTKESKPEETDEIYNATIFNKDLKGAEPSIKEYVVQNSLIELPVKITRLVEIIE